jgi:hypothetical protein
MRGAEAGVTPRGGGMESTGRRWPRSKIDRPPVPGRLPRREYGLLRKQGVRILEARFHPWRKAQGPFLVVGRVVCRLRRAVVEPNPSAQEDPAWRERGTMLQKLNYLVGRSGPDAFHELLRLRSEFWSFVEILEEGGGDERQ